MIETLSRPEMLDNKLKIRSIKTIGRNVISVFFSEDDVRFRIGQLHSNLRPTYWSPNWLTLVGAESRVSLSRRQMAPLRLSSKGCTKQTIIFCTNLTM